MTIKTWIKETIQKRGFTLERFPLYRFFSDQNFDLVFDVGANRGQYATELRKKYGYRGEIISFEPMKDAFGKLQNSMADDSLWEGRNWGLGAETGEQVINVAGNSASSSLFEMLPSHTDALPTSGYVDNESIEVHRLDEIFDQFAAGKSRILLKVDTQGYELEVLKGASAVLSQVNALQLEISLSPLYDGAPLLEDVVSHARASGFVPYWFLPGFWNPKTHQQLQVEGLFVRETVL